MLVPRLYIFEENFLKLWLYIFRLNSCPTRLIIQIKQNTLLTSVKLLIYLCDVTTPHAWPDSYDELISILEIAHLNNALGLQVGTKPM